MGSAAVGTILSDRIQGHLPDVDCPVRPALPLIGLRVQDEILYTADVVRVIGQLCKICRQIAVEVQIYEVEIIGARAARAVGGVVGHVGKIGRIGDVAGERADSLDGEFVGSADGTVGRNGGVRYGVPGNTNLGPAQTVSLASCNVIRDSVEGYRAATVSAMLLYMTVDVD